MAIKNDILAQKLARPPRRPRTGPVVSEDGATHYRVFDEPDQTLHIISDSEPRTEETFTESIPLPIEERVVLTSYQAENTPAIISQSMPQHKIDDINPLEMELMLSGIASTVLLYLMGRVIDDTGVTAPVVIDEYQKQSSINLTSIRKAIQRLEKKGIIERFRIKNGRRGWTQYKICNYTHLKNILHTNK